MSNPEQGPENFQPQRGVERVPGDVEVSETVKETLGVKTIPSTPAPLNDDNNQPLATPVPHTADPDPLDPSQVAHISDFASEEQVGQYSKGKAFDAITWHAKFVLRKIQQALVQGKKVIFGN